jgi:hypothetical protein
MAIPMRLIDKRIFDKDLMQGNSTGATMQYGIGPRFEIHSVNLLPIDRSNNSSNNLSRVNVGKVHGRAKHTSTYIHTTSLVSFAPLLVRVFCSCVGSEDATLAVPRRADHAHYLFFDYYYTPPKKFHPCFFVSENEKGTSGGIHLYVVFLVFGQTIEGFFLVVDLLSMVDVATRIVARLGTGRARRSNGWIGPSFAECFARHTM